MELMQHFTYNDKNRSELEDGANDTHCTDEDGDDASSYKQSSSRDDDVPSHKSKIVVFVDQPATNTDDW